MSFSKNPQQELEQGATQATQEAMQSVMTALSAVLETMRQQERECTLLNAGQRNGTNRAAPSEQPIEVMWDGEVVYQEDGRGGAYASSMTLEEVNVLAAALKISSGERIADSEISASLSIGDRRVLQIEQGVVRINELQEEAENYDRLARLTNQPTLGSNNGNGFHPVPPQGAALPITIQEPLTLQVQKVREKPPSILERLDRTCELAAPLRTEKWMKMPLTQRVSAAVAERFTSIRRRQVADTAIELLQKYGKREGQQFVYQTEDYVLTGKGKTVRVHDREGRELLSLRTRAIGAPKVVGYYLTPEQERDFVRVRQGTKNLGWEHLSQDPLVRSQQLGSLTPAGDLKLTEDLKALAVVDVARRLLDVSGTASNTRNGKRVLEGSQYRIEESPQGLKIETKDRGEILHLDRGQLTSHLTAQDVRHFIFVAQELSRELRQIQPTSAAMKVQAQR